MTLERAYLDHNATSPLRPAARQAVLSALDTFGNPSSVHAEGRAARGIIEEVREDIAAAFQVAADRVFFTSGGTEAANTVLGHARLADALYVGAVEHPCVLSGHDCAQKLRPLPVDGEGVVVLGELVPRSLIAVQAVNNETGVIQPLAEVAARAKEAGALFICDAVQAVGRLEISDLSRPDIVFFSAHKFGGPKGVGAVVMFRDDLPVTPLIKGGGQERRWRSGTENVAAIAGFGAAFKEATAAQQAEAKRLGQLRARLETAIFAIAPDAVVFGRNAPRVANTTCFAVPGLKAELLLMALDLDGVSVSSGSACSSGRIETSHVLAAMGVDGELAQGAIRVSTGWTTTEGDIDKFLTAFAKFCGARNGRRAA